MVGVVRLACVATAAMVAVACAPRTEGRGDVAPELTPVVYAAIDDTALGASVAAVVAVQQRLYDGLEEGKTVAELLSILTEGELAAREALASIAGVDPARYRDVCAAYPSRSPSPAAIERLATLYDTDRTMKAAYDAFVEAFSLPNHQ